MKKYLYLIGVILVSILALNVYAIADDEAPVLNNVSVNATTFNPGDNITITFNATDNLTGIDTFDLEFRMKNNHSIYIPFMKQSLNNANSYTMQIPENALPGVYEAYAIQLWDGAGNLKTYYSGQTGEFNFPTIEITINDSGKDYVPPVLNSISVSPSTLTAPGKFTVTANITDDRSEIKEVVYGYFINDQLQNLWATKTGENTYTMTYTFTDKQVYADALFLSVQITDAAGNSNRYVYDSSRDRYSNGREIKLDTNLDVTISNKIVDKNPPVLQNFGYNSNKVSAPGSVDIWMNLKDDKSGVNNIEVHFKGVDKNGRQTHYWLLYPDYNSGNGKATFKHTFDQYEPETTFYIEQIIITDKAGNKVNYTILDDGNPTIEKKELILTEAIVGDTTTSTVNKDYVDVIKNTDDNKTIMLDTTFTDVAKKDVFDSIKGTNKSVVLVNDGIQWVFNGNEIVNATKDINTSVEVYKVNESGYRDYNDFFNKKTNALVIEFANNGVLPGRALIKIKADYTLRDYMGISDLFVYYIEEKTDSLEYIAQKVKVNNEGYYEFYITHNSKYLMSKAKAKPQVVKNDSTEELGNDVLEELEEGEDLTDVVEKQKDEVKKEKDKISTKTIIIIVVCSLVPVLVIVILLIIFRKKISRFFRKKRANKETKKEEKKLKRETKKIEKKSKKEKKKSKKKIKEKEVK